MELSEYESKINKILESEGIEKEKFKPNIFQMFDEKIPIDEAASKIVQAEKVQKRYKELNPVVVEPELDIDAEINTM